MKNRAQAGIVDVTTAWPCGSQASVRKESRRRIWTQPRQLRCRAEKESKGSICLPAVQCSPHVHKSSTRARLYQAVSAIGQTDGRAKKAIQYLRQTISMLR